MADIQNELYQLSNGRINIPLHSKQSEGTFAEKVYDGTKVTTDPVRREFRTEENAVYDTQRRVQQVVAVSSLVMGNYASVADSNAYNRANFGGTNDQNVKTFMNNIGYGNSAEQSLQKQSSSLVFNISAERNSTRNTGLVNYSEHSGASASNLNAKRLEKIEGINKSFLDDASGNALKSTSFNDLTHSEIQSVINTGSFARTFTGQDGAKITQVYTLDRSNRSSVTKLQETLSAAKNEQSNRERLLNATTNSQKADMMRDIRNSGVQHLKAQGGVLDGIGRGSAKECADVMKKLDAAIAKASPGSPELAKLISQKQELTTFMDLSKGMASNRDIARGQNQHMQGRRIVQQHILGSDMMRGVDFYRNSYRVTQLATRATVRTTAWAGQKMTHGATKVVGKINDNVVAKINSNASDRLNNMLKSTNDFADGRMAKLKEKTEARRNGTMREYRNQQKALHKQAKIEKKETVRTRKQAVEDKLRGKTNRTKREERQLRKIDRKKARKTRRLDRQSRVKDKFGWVSNLTGKFKDAFKNVGKRIFKVIKAPFDVVNLAKKFVRDLVKKILTKVFAVISKPLALFAGFYLLICAIVCIFVVLIHFISSMTGTNFLAAWDINYMQYIVDGSTSEDGICVGFNEVAQSDAIYHYEEENPIMSYQDKGTTEGSYVTNTDHMINWHKKADGGDIRHIWMTLEIENGTPESERMDLASTSANLMPIASVMHCRMLGEIDWENYATAWSYINYMYVQTHDVAGYDYIDADNHANNTLYKANAAVTSNGRTVFNSNGVVFKSYSIDNRGNDDYSYGRPVRNVELDENGTSVHLCQNIYIHGYDLNSSLDGNRMNEGAGADKLDLLNCDYYGDCTAKEILDSEGAHLMGMFGEIPYDTIEGVNYYCDNYMAVRYGMDEGVHTNEDVCPGAEHTHKSGCYDYVGITIIEGTNTYSYTASGSTYTNTHTHSDSTRHKGSSCNTGSCSHSCLDTDACVKDYYFSGGGKSSDATACPSGETIINTIVTSCSHSHSQSCCNAATITFTKKDIPTTWEDTTTDNSNEGIDYLYVKADGTATKTAPSAGAYTTYKLKCGKEGHIHTDWVSANEPGCWTTGYICLGHCGGHITPQIDVQIDYDWESIAKKDFYKVTYLMSESDMVPGASGTGNTIEEWKDYWNSKMAMWFLPFPNSPTSCLELCVDNTLHALAYIADGVTGWFVDGFKWLLGLDIDEEDVDTVEEIQELAEEAGDDVFAFPGWYLEDGTLNQEYIKELEDFYGRYDDNNYELGYKNWEEIGECVFPLAGGKAVPAAQQKAILDYLADEGVSEQRLAVVSEALQRCGAYFYVLSGDAHANGVNNTSGKSECSGFVSGVLNRALGVTTYSTGWSASTFFNSGSAVAPSAMQPGDVISHANGGTGSSGVSYTGHVMIYVGILEIEGFDEDQHYVIDCSSTVGGTSLRPCYNINNYTHAYRGCYSD